MPANRKEPESAPFWFQSATGRPHGGFMPSGAPTAAQQVARMAASYSSATGRPHGGLLQQPNRSPAWRPPTAAQQVARMAASYSRATGRPHGGFMPSGAPT